jgi:hypothetical protein
MIKLLVALILTTAAVYASGFVWDKKVKRIENEEVICYMFENMITKSGGLSCKWKK